MSLHQGYVKDRMNHFGELLDTVPRVERGKYVQELLLQQRTYVPINVTAQSPSFYQARLASQESKLFRSALGGGGPVVSQKENSDAMLRHQRKAEREALKSVTQKSLVTGGGRKLW